MTAAARQSRVLTTAQDSTMAGLGESAPAPCELWEGAGTVTLGPGWGL